MGSYTGLIPLVRSVSKLLRGGILLAVFWDACFSRDSIS